MQDNVPYSGELRHASIQSGELQQKQEFERIWRKRLDRNTVNSMELFVLVSTIEKAYDASVP